MKTGYIKLDRKLIDSDDYLKERFDKTHAWIDLLFLAAYEETKVYVRGQVLTLKRGQLARSHKFLAERWQWSRTTVIKYLEYLEDVEHRIEQQRNNVTTLISIVNYDKYQLFDTDVVNTDLNTDLNTINKTIEDNNSRNIKNNITRSTSDKSSVETRVREDVEKKQKPAKKTKEERKSDFYNTIVPYVNKYGSAMCRSFYDYWTQDSQDAPTKLLFEVQKGWSIGYRLSTWNKKSKKDLDGNSDKPKVEDVKW